MTSTTYPIDRIPYIDILRGFAIMLVVLGHAIQYSVKNFDDYPLFRLIYAFHMPLFMFISGFVYRHGTRNPWLFLRNKSQILVLPFISWLLITFIWFHTITVPNAVEFLKGVIKSPDAGGLWFLWVLFLIYVVMAFSQFIAPRRAVMVTLCFYIVLNLLIHKIASVNVLGLGLLCWYLLFFVIGHVWALKLPRNRPSLVTSLIFTLVFIMLMTIWQRGGNNVIEGYFANYPHLEVLMLVKGYNYITALSAIVALMGIFRIITEKYGKYLSKMRLLGLLTLEIYVTHIYFLSTILWFTSQYSLVLPIRVMLMFIGALIGALFLQAMIKKIPILAFLMFGRTISRINGARLD